MDEIEEDLFKRWRMDDTEEKVVLDDESEEVMT